MAKDPRYIYVRIPRELHDRIREIVYYSKERTSITKITHMLLSKALKKVK